MGDHFLLNLYGCDVEKLNNEKFLVEMFEQAVVEGKMTLLNLITHKFEPQGITAVALLSESHISIHTWPENGMAVCDVFTCGEHTNPRSGATYMYEAMGATDLVSEIFIRPLK